MQDIIYNPEVEKCKTTFKAGEALFLEGDDSQDMYILVEGRLDIYKDDKIISEIDEPGSMVGEMSFLLGAKRTATVKAAIDSILIFIPSSNIEKFLNDYPTLAPRITQHLARRLQETTKVVHGLKEFSDQLPDAVVMTDRERNILAWNRAAEKLHGRTWHQMKGHSLADVYQDPKEYQQFIEDIKAGRSLQEKVLNLKHSDGEERFVSISTTVLYDGHHNVEGFIFLGRDVSNIVKLENKYRRIRNWLIPAILLVVFALASLFVGMPHLSKGVRILDYKKQAFREKIEADFDILRSNLSSYLVASDQDGVQTGFKSYFDERNPEFFCISGLLLLDRDKKVVNAYAPDWDDLAASLINSNYSGLEFKGKETSRHRILNLFRPTTENPMGAEGVEIAFDLGDMNGDAGWLVFQIDQQRLNQEYGIDGKSLEKIDFLQP